MKVFKQYVRQRCLVLLLLLVWAGIFACVLALYRLPTEAVGYAALLCAAATVGLGLADFAFWYRKWRNLKLLGRRITLGLEGMPESGGPVEEAYQELLEILYRDRQERISSADADRREMLDYYTLWVHQIKTPIAAMGLLLQGDETERGRELSAELFKTEQYVEMVLQYLRLGSESTDYLIRSCDLAGIVKQAVRKYAVLFIRGRVQIELQPISGQVLTDEKWLTFVVEQLLSNAVKYARGGKVTISAEGDTLVIADNGIGIASEDLPRVFEKGYTGCNGREEQRSTGIGLYLCRQICDRLGHDLSLTSQAGEGTEVRLLLRRPEIEVE